MARLIDPLKMVGENIRLFILQELKLSFIKIIDQWHMIVLDDMDELAVL
jgi:hypothetical protein